MTCKANVGDYGQSLTYTLRNCDGTVADLSAGTSSQTIRFVRPDGTTVDAVGSFGTDGTDGVVTGTVPSGAFSIEGTYHVFVRVVGPSLQFTAEVDPIPVGSDYGA